MGCRKILTQVKRNGILVLNSWSGDKANLLRFTAVWWYDQSTVLALVFVPEQFQSGAAKVLLVSILAGPFLSSVTGRGIASTQATKQGTLTCTGHIDLPQKERGEACRCRYQSDGAT